MTRTTVVTSAASGMGPATAKLLRAQGQRVIGLVLRAADVSADLSNSHGCAAAIVGLTAASGGAIDALVHRPGIAQYEPLTMSVNYFGAVALLEGLLPLLTKSRATLAVVVTSYAATMTHDQDLAVAAPAGDEARAVMLGAEAGVGNYTAIKAALASGAAPRRFGPSGRSEACSSTWSRRARWRRRLFRTA